MLKSFPLLLVSIIAYNALIFGGAAFTGTDANTILARAVSFTMFSDDVWRFTLGDLIVLLTLGLLFVESSEVHPYERNASPKSRDVDADLRHRPDRVSRAQGLLDDDVFLRRGDGVLRRSSRVHNLHCWCQTRSWNDGYSHRNELRRPCGETQGMAGTRETASAGPADQLSDSGMPRFWISSMV